MKRILIILPALSLLLTGCFKEPVAEALITPNPAYVGEDITFTNLSTNTNYWEWDLDDGTTSLESNLIHYYYDPGRYDVTLKAFGKKGGINVATYVIDVVGSELKIIVKEVVDEYYVQGASVILYNTYDDWLNFENPVGDEQFTNSVGECMFTGLSYQRYYVDVWEANHDNWLLGEDHIDWIETQELPGGYDHTFIAFVEYYETTAKKSLSTRPATRDFRSGERTPGAPRVLKENKISEPKEK